jgi:hypothetical protein
VASVEVAWSADVSLLRRHYGHQLDLYLVHGSRRDIDIRIRRRQLSWAGRLTCHMVPPQVFMYPQVLLSFDRPGRYFFD